MDWQITCFVTVSLFVLALLIYILLYYKFDKKITRDIEDTVTDLYNGPLASLLNGSGINNIPNLNLVTTNPEVAKANNCEKGPIFIGDTSGTDADCIRTCVNSGAKVINVADGETAIYNSTILQRGAHCYIGPRPECNMKTSMAMMTVNSIVCRSKFPKLVGGPSGSTIVACNNNLINDPQNILWDYKGNARFNPFTSTITDEDELLPDGTGTGTYRFRCRFNGVDVRGNLYQEHPFDRLHPIINYCADSIYRAHPDVKTIFSKDRKTFECDCGDPNETRVRHLDPNDRRSQCADISLSIKSDIKERKIMTVPYRCFTLYSTLDDVGKYPPCPDDQFTRDGSQLGSVEFQFTEKENELIEHPLYKDLSAMGVHTYSGRSSKKSLSPIFSLLRL